MTIIQLKIDYQDGEEEFKFTYMLGERVMLCMILDFKQFSEMTQDMQKIVNSVNRLQAEKYLANKASEQNDEKINVEHCQAQNLGLERSSNESTETQSKES